MLGKKTVIGLTIAVAGVALAVLFGVQAEKSTHCDASELSHSATTATDRAYESQANRYCSHQPDDALAVPAGLGVLVAVGGLAYAAVQESRRRKLASAVAHRAKLGYEGYLESRARQAQERRERELAEAEARAQAEAAVTPPPPAPQQEFAGTPSPGPVYDYPAYAGEPVSATPVEEDSTPPPPAPTTPPPATSSDPFGGLFQ